MKFTVSMKDPDTLHDSMRQAVRDDVAKLGLIDSEAELIEDSRCEDVERICHKWFQYGEYLKVEIDTEAMTCVVVPTR